ncbi:MAG TPA: insulinase family protein, partial [Longimicrobium sp.]
MEDLDATSLDDVADFFRTFYAPDNAVLTLCGDFDRDTARSLIERYFGPIPRGPGLPPLPGTPDVNPLQLGREIRETVEQPVAAARVYLAYRIPPYGTPDYYAADVLSELLAGGKSARLYRSLVRERRLASAITAMVFPVVTGAALFVMRGSVLPGQPPEPVELALLEELGTLGREGPTEREMERAVTGLEARHLLGLQKTSERADTLSMLETYFGDPGLIETELDRYRAVTAADVRRFVTEYLSGENRVVLTYVPQAAPEAA